MRGARDRQHKRRIRGDRENERQRKGYSAKSRKEFKGKLGRGLGRRRFTVPGEKEEGGARGGGCSYCETVFCKSNILE